MTDFFADTPYIKFYVDFEAALRTLDAKEIRSTQILKAIDALNMLGSKAKITLVWTRAHVGHRS